MIILTLFEGIILLCIANRRVAASGSTASPRKVILSLIFRAISIIAGCRLLYAHLEAALVQFKSGAVEVGIVIVEYTGGVL